MILNPEFRRNLWLELTPQRLIMMPVILLLLFIVLEEFSGFGGFGPYGAGVWIFLFVAVFWGCRRAAASLGDEVREATWDGQRMSALGPWAMSWGKLLGATAFTWYGGFFCLLLVVLQLWPPIMRDRIPYEIVSLVQVALIGQTVSFAAALAWLRKTRPTRRIPIGLCFMLGLAAASAADLGRRWFGPEIPIHIPRSASDTEFWGSTVSWFLWDLPGLWFYLISLSLFAAWSVLSVYRLMQAELQVRIRSWAWLSFTLFVMVYAVGLVEGLSWRSHWSERVGPLMVIAFGVAHLLCYGIVFLDAKDPVRFRALLAQSRGGDWPAALSTAPPWLIGLLLAFVVGVVAIVVELLIPSVAQWPAELGPLRPGPEGTVVLLLASLAFLLRDVALILMLNLGRWRQRADQAGVVYLALLYGLFPPVLGLVGWEGAMGLFLPGGFFGGGWDSALSGAAQAAVAVAALVWVWRRLEDRLARSLAPAQTEISSVAGL